MACHSRHGHKNAIMSRANITLIIALLAIVFTLAWIIWPECPQVQAHRAHIAGMAAWFSWFLPWSYIQVRDAWYNLKPAPVNMAALKEIEELMSLPDEEEWVKWNDGMEPSTEIAYQKKTGSHEHAGKNEIDFEIN